MKQCILFFAIGVALFSVGCKQSGKIEGLAPVFGIVIFEDKPVEGANILFSPAGGGDTLRAASADTDQNGRFVMRTLTPGDGVVPGEYTVIIRKTEHIGEYKEETLPGGAVRGHYDDPRIVDKLPIKYSDAKYSDLKITIPPEGNKKVEFRLEGKVDSTPKDPRQARGR